MSRYSAKLENGRTIAWGYDRPLSEYFIQEYYSEKEMEDRDEDDETVFCISSYFTMKCHPDNPHKMRYSNSELLDIFKKYPIPEKHIDCLAGDLQF